VLRFAAGCGAGASAGLVAIGGAHHQAAIHASLLVYIRYPLLQGVVLEPALGSARFAVLVAELLLVSQLLLVLLARALAAVAPALAGSYYSACAVGFSGVLFALKVRILSERCLDIRATSQQQLQHAAWRAASAAPAP